MEKAHGLFMELSSCSKLALEAGGSPWRAKGSWDSRECHLWNSFEQLMDGFFVCVAQSRVAWQGAASPSPPQA